MWNLDNDLWIYDEVVEGGAKLKILSPFEQRDIHSSIMSNFAKAQPQYR